MTSLAVILPVQAKTDTKRQIVIFDSDNTGYGVKVAIIDTGIDVEHPDLIANIKGGYNASSKKSHMMMIMAMERMLLELS